MTDQQTDTTLEPVRCSVTVRCAPERAFEAFTAEMARWWPTATHSIEGDAATDVVVDGRVGGSIRERQRDGTESSWADITVWDPPHRLAMSWHPNPNPTVATDVDVRFVDQGDGTTVVELTHTGWERLAERATPLRAEYATGWPFVMGHYVDHAGAA